MRLADLRDSLTEFMADYRPHQRRFCYIGDTKVGYVVPVKDGYFRRTWAWVACDMGGNILGVTKPIEEAQALCIAAESRKVRRFSVQRNQPTVIGELI